MYSRASKKGGLASDWQEKKRAGGWEDLEVLMADYEGKKALLIQLARGSGRITRYMKSYLPGVGSRRTQSVVAMRRKRREG